MAELLSAFARVAISKTGYTPSSGDVNVTLETDDPDGVADTQDLAANTVEALDLKDVSLPCAKILLKLISPASGVEVEVSLQTGGSFDANRFAVLAQVNDFAVWTPKLGTAIYVKAVGGGARIMVVAG